MTDSKSPREVHLVGSVPLASEEEVFRTTSAILDTRLRKIPDGETGRRRIAAAERVVPAFGIATECGLGRRDPGTIADLLKLHAAVA